MITNQAEYDAMLAFLNGAPSGSEFFHPTLHLYVRNSPYIQNNINEFVEIMRHDGWCANSVSSDFFDKLLCLKDIKHSLLEYRRANKIYEVGDFIIDTLIGNKVIKYHDGYKLMPSNYVSAFLMHASDAEIEANRRLDLPESVVKSLGEVS